MDSPAFRSIMSSQQCRAFYLAARLHEAFVAVDQGQRLALTGAIIPHGTLKSLHIRRKLSFVETLENKFVTLAVARRTVICLEKRFYISVPRIPGLSHKDWRERQAKRILNLCYRVKKNLKARNSPQKKPKRAMEDTLVYDGEARSRVDVD